MKIIIFFSILLVVIFVTFLAADLIDAYFLDLDDEFLSDDIPKREDDTIKVINTYIVINNLVLK